ncbi:MAG TPA: hypothetical protein VGM20_13135 [Gemmatimonadales bacterium]|jgi:hypothetical protein
MSEFNVAEGAAMTRHALLKGGSVLSIVLMTLHFASDTARAQAGSPEAGGMTILAVPILVIWLYGALVLDEKRSGHVIMLIGSFLAIMMPAMHVIGPNGPFSGTLTRAGDPYLFVWTLHALGVTGLFTLILAVQGMWDLRRRQL